MSFNVVQQDEASSELQKQWVEAMAAAGVDGFTALDAATKLVAGLLVQLSPENVKARRELGRQHMNLAVVLSNELLKAMKSAAVPAVNPLCEKPWLN